MNIFHISLITKHKLTQHLPEWYTFNFHGNGITINHALNL